MARTVLRRSTMRAVTFAIVIGCVAATSHARAQGRTVAAEALFDEGRKWMAEKKPELACPKFAESQRLDPSPSTLLNLGSCYEKLGKTATAWATYKAAASLASAQGRSALVPVATRHASALEPMLARIEVRVGEPASGLVVKTDDVELGPSGATIPVDPGTHRVEASAPNKRPWSSSVDVRTAGETVTVTVPPLEDAPPPPTLTAAEVPPAPPRASVTAEPATEPSRGSPQRTIGIVTTGVGIAGLVAGTVFLVRAKVKYDESREHCPFDKNQCYPEGVGLRDDARTSGNIATFAYVASAAAIATGVVLWITAPSSESRRGSIGVSPTASGLLVQGSF